MTSTGRYGLFLDGDSKPVLNDPQSYGSNGYGYMGFSATSAQYAAGYTSLFSGALSTHPIYVEGGSIGSSALWASGRVYHIRHADVSIGSFATLTLSPETIIKFESGSLGIHVAGTLTADATAGHEIVFTDYRDDTAGGDTNQDSAVSSPAAGSWKEIDIYGNAVVTLNHCIIRYTGSSGYGAVYKTGNSKLTLTNSVISDSISYGVQIGSSSGVSHLISGNSIVRHSFSGISLDSVDGAITISGNIIGSTGQHGIVINNGGSVMTLAGNTIQNTGTLFYGIYLSGSSSPLLADAQTFGSNGKGPIGFDIQASGGTAAYDALFPGVPVYVEASTLSSGTLSWSSSRGYLVRGSVTTNSGTELDITGGVVVKFEQHAGFASIGGAVKAAGTSNNKCCGSVYRTQKRCFNCACILVNRGARFIPNQYRMAKLAMLMLCISPVIVVGTMREVLL